jgi:hypothetical protein
MSVVPEVCTESRDNQSKTGTILKPRISRTSSTSVTSSLLYVIGARIRSADSLVLT